MVNTRSLESASVAAHNPNTQDINTSNNSLENFIQQQALQNILNFHYNGNPSTLEYFIAKCNNLIESEKVRHIEPQIINSITSSFVGEAEQFIRGKDYNWHELRSALIKRFSESSDVAYWRNKLNVCHQGDNESVFSFKMRLKEISLKIVDAMTITFDIQMGREHQRLLPYEVLNNFKLGLLPEIRNFINLASVDTLDEAYVLAERKEIENNKRKHQDELYKMTKLTNSFQNFNLQSNSSRQDFSTNHRNHTNYRSTDHQQGNYSGNYRNPSNKFRKDLNSRQNFQNNGNNGNHNNYYNHNRNRVNNYNSDRGNFSNNRRNFDNHDRPSFNSERNDNRYRNYNVQNSNTNQFSNGYRDNRNNARDYRPTQENRYQNNKNNARDFNSKQDKRYQSNYNEARNSNNSNGYRVPEKPRYRNRDSRNNSGNESGLPK